MKNKEDLKAAIGGHDKSALVVWENKFVTNIDLIDKQHKELVNLTNNLYQTCMGRDPDKVKDAFKKALQQMVEYVRFHFNAEVELLKRINYPDYPAHKAMHDELIGKILEAAQDYNSGKHFVPNSFVRTLKDWVFGHIAFHDKNYALYIANQKKKGLLNDQQING
ncbi:MAG: bacteriohemerythrin [Spirochaetaceae bacterium]|nr:bacteriohemerythrin [Spirochaetaceae bacterium]